MARSGERGGMGAALRERARQANLRPCRLFDPLQRRERLNRLLVRRDPLREFLLRGLRERQTGDGAGDALLVSCRPAAVAALAVLVLGQCEPAGDEVDERERLQRPADVGAILDGLEMRAAFSKRGARLVEVAEPEVHVADAEERRALIVPIVARFPFGQDTSQRIERRGVVALREEYPPQTLERIGFAGGVHGLAVEVAAARIVGDRGRELSLEVQHIPRADERRRDRAGIPEALLEGERFAVGCERRLVFGERVADGGDAERAPPQCLPDRRVCARW